MLVLTRHDGQRICLGDNVVLTVLSTRKGKVRLGIEAPASLAVDREEIWLKRKAESDAPMAALSRGRRC